MSTPRSVLQLETALEEIGRTCAYAGLPDPTDAVVAAVVVRRQPRARLPVRLGRPALIALVLLLALAAAAVAYLAVTGWLSAGPRGVQFTDTFSFGEVYRHEGVPARPGPRPVIEVHTDFAMGDTDGSSMYGIWMPSYPEPDAVLVRFTGLAHDKLQRDVVTSFSDLADPALWGGGVDVGAAHVGVPMADSSYDLLAVAPDGQVFVVAAAYGRDRVPVEGADRMAEEIRSDWADLPPAELEGQIAMATTRRPFLTASVIAVSPDGLHRRVLTLDELEDRGPGTTDGRPVSIGIAASAPDQLWIQVLTGDSTTPRLYQVVDPDGDGDWSDRIARRIALPDSVPPASAQVRYLQPVAETSTPEADRSASILLPVLDADGTYTVFRVADTNADGDAGDLGEAVSVFSVRRGAGDLPPPALTSRVVVDGGGTVIGEFLVTGVTRSTRIARVDEEGRVRDIARAIEFGAEDVVAAPNGDIFVMVQEPSAAGVAPAFLIYRLTPDTAGRLDGAPLSAVRIVPERSLALAP